MRLAEKMAAKAIKYKRSMALEPMNSYERHVIHTAVPKDSVRESKSGIPNMHRRRISVTVIKM